MRAKLTVLIPCKDERANIGPCIESVRAVADEILIADSLSTDETLDIVRAAGGCRIIEREFIDYANFKNWAIGHARHEWVLIVDADERVTDEMTEELRRVLVNPPETVDGYWVGRRCFFMGHELKHGGWNTDEVFRLFRRDRCRYRKCRVHEEIDVDPRRAAKLRSRLLHYSFWNYDQYFGKQLRYAKLGAADMWDRGRRTGLVGLLLRPLLRFILLYFVRLGFLDGLAGLQCAMLTAFNTFAKQARLWEFEHAKEPPPGIASGRRPRSSVAADSPPAQRPAA